MTKDRCLLTHLYPKEKIAEVDYQFHIVRSILSQPTKLFGWRKGLRWKILGTKAVPGPKFPFCLCSAERVNTILSPTLMPKKYHDCLLAISGRNDDFWAVTTSLEEPSPARPVGLVDWNRPSPSSHVQGLDMAVPGSRTESLLIYLKLNLEWYN